MPKVSSSGWATTARRRGGRTGGGQARRHANSSTPAATWSGTSIVGKWLRASSRCTSNHGWVPAKACWAASTSSSAGWA